MLNKQKNEFIIYLIYGDHSKIPLLEASGHSATAEQMDMYN